VELVLIISTLDFTRKPDQTRIDITTSSDARLMLSAVQLAG